MAGINFQQGPGGRMKRAQQGKVLYVNTPNDPRLRAYQDSSALHNYSEQQSKIEGKTPHPQYWGPNSRSSNHSKITPNLETRMKDYKSSWVDRERTGHSLAPTYGTFPNYVQKQEELFKTTKKLVDTNKNIEYMNNLSSPDISHKTIKPVGFYTGTGINDIYKKPEREVIYQPPAASSGGAKKQPVRAVKRTIIPPVPRPAVNIVPPPIETIQERMDPVEPLSPLQASPQEIITPVMRPTPQTVKVQTVPPLVEKPVVAQKPAEAPVRRGPKAIMPTRQGGWSNQPLLMRLFPKLYAR